jgi:transposase
LAELAARIAALEASNLALQGQVRDLADRLKPPPPPKPVTPQPPAPAKKATGKKPGGQPGHPPHLRQLVPPERIADTIHYLPETCSRCQAALPVEASADDPAPVRHQVAELPKVVAEVIEHQAHARTCPACRTVTRAVLPPEVRRHCLGPNMTAVLAYLAGNHGISKRGVEEIAENVFGVPIGLGTVANLEQEVSGALVPAYQEARAAVVAAPVKHVDETGWKQKGKKRWLWAAATARVVAFVIHSRRNLEALKLLVGDALAGILCSDRWKVYDYWPVRRRQLCWAHLKRNWEKKVEGGGVGKTLGEAWLEIHRQVFEVWHLFREGKISRHEMGDRMAPLALRVAVCLDLGCNSRDAKLARFCTRLAGVQLALWAFTVEEGVEPTNNHAERVQRRAVLWRRRSFGCQSADGCRFVERILTVVGTLRLQQRSVVEFLSETMKAHRSGQRPPQLVVTG